MSASALLPAAVRRTDDVLAQADLAEAAIPAAIEAGAVDDLVTLVSRADAQKLYEQSQQHTAEALRLTRLKLRCEAALGLIDIRETGFQQGGFRSPPPTRDGFFSSLSKSQRARWRQIATFLDRGVLDVAMDAASDTGELNLAGLARVGATHGYCYVPIGAVRAALRASGRSAQEIAAAAGADLRGVQRLLWSQGRHGTQTRVSWWRAASVISAAGGDPHGLPFASRKVGRRARRRLWVTRQPKATGSRWDEAQVRLYALVSEIDALAPNNSAYHADLWDHLEAVRAFVLRQQRRKETAA